MNINQMRAIDKMIGIPLCALLSGWRRIVSFFSSRKPEPPLRRLLFIEMSEMGSIVLAYSMLRKAASLFPRAKLYFLTFQNHRAAIDILGLIPEERIVTIDPANPIKFIRTAATALLRLRRLRLDAVVDMELFSRFSAILSFLSGAGFRSGFYQYHQEGLYRGHLLTHPVQFNPHLHISRNLLALVYALAPETQEKPMVKTSIPDNDIHLPRFRADSEEKDAIRQKIKKELPHYKGTDILVLLNPNAGDIVPLRRWPLQRYVQLGRSVLTHPGVTLIITGTAGERRQARHLAEKIDSTRCLNLAGMTTFRELMVLYDTADILVTNDSGPAHFSAMTEIRSAVLYGPETPKLYGPLSSRSRVFYSGYACSPCVSAFNHRLTPCRSNRCLQSISAAAVYQAVKPWLPAEKDSSAEPADG